MITKTNAVKMSIRKWEKIVDGDKEAIEEDCGFCEFFPRRCRKCPLFPDVCNWGDSCPKALYWQYEQTGNPQIAELILAAIKERGDKWIKEQK